MNIQYCIAKCAITLFLLSGAPSPFLDPFEEALSDPLSTPPPFLFYSLTLLVICDLGAFNRISLFDFELGQKCRALKGDRVEPQAEHWRQVWARR